MMRGRSIRIGKAILFPGRRGTLSFDRQILLFIADKGANSVKTDRTDYSLSSPLNTGVTNNIFVKKTRALVKFKVYYLEKTNKIKEQVNNT